MNSSLRSTSSLRQSASLAGSELGLQRGLAALRLLVLPGGDPGAGGGDDLLQHGAGLLLLVLLGRGEEGLEFLGDDGRDDPVGRRGAQHLLGLALELRLGEPDGDHGGEALGGVVLGDVVLGDAQQLAGAQHLVDGLGQRALEAGDVGAALGGGDDVDEGAQRGVVAGAPAQRDVHSEVAGDLRRGHVAEVVQDRHGLLEGALAAQPQHVADRLVGGQELAELGDAAVVVEDRLLDLLALGEPLVTHDDGKSGDEEGSLPGAVVQVLQGQLGVLEEDLPVGPVADPGAGAGLGHLAGPGEAVGGLEGRVRGGLGEDAGGAAAEADRVGVAVAVDLDVQPRGERVDDRGADAVQTAGGRVRAAAELAARVQLGHHDLDARQSGLGLDVDRDAAAVVADLDRGVRVQQDLDAVAVAAQRLVDRVVDDLPEAVHQTTAVGGTDVHAGALADGLQALQDEQVPRGVVGTVVAGQQRGRHGRFGTHAALSSVKFCLIGHIRTHPDHPPVQHAAPTVVAPCARTPATGAQHGGPARRSLYALREQGPPSGVGPGGAISSRYHRSWRNVGSGRGSGTAVMQATGARDGAYAPTRQRIMLRGPRHRSRSDVRAMGGSRDSARMNHRPPGHVLINTAESSEKKSHERERFRPGWMLTLVRQLVELEKRRRDYCSDTCEPADRG
ncbi:hypothetical protein KAURM247S_01557 [Kitasatospora aureofaciens]